MSAPAPTLDLAGVSLVRDGRSILHPLDWQVAPEDRWARVLAEVADAGVVEADGEVGGASSSEGALERVTAASVARSGVRAVAGWAPEAAHGFLRPLTERDAADAVIGVFPGLSLGNHPHRLSVNGRQMSAWCAEDTLFLPALLGQTAMIESTSPLSRAPVRLTVSPDGVTKVSPPEAVLSIAVGEGDKRLTSVEAIWTTFCQNIHFFATREEAVRWAAGRDDIAILTPDQGYELGRQLTRRFLDQLS